MPVAKKAATTPTAESITHSQPSAMIIAFASAVTVRQTAASPYQSDATGRVNSDSRSGKKDEI
jgi:hypothetical protein